MEGESITVQSTSNVRNSTDYVGLLSASTHKMSYVPLLFDNSIRSLFDASLKGHQYLI